MSKILMFEKMISMVNNVINCGNFLLTYKMSKTDFTRNRKMSFTDNIVLILTGLKNGIQIGIREYLREKRSIEESYSKQAFSKGRLRIKPEAFLELSRNAVADFYQTGIHETFKGYRVCAIDGTDYNLPTNKETLEKFGSEKYGKSQQAQAQCSYLYDVLNCMAIDVCVDRFDSNERDLAIKNLENFKDIKTDRELILMDRGYPSEKIIAYLEDNGYKYVLRCNKDNFFKEIKQANEVDQYVERKFANKETYRFRVVNIRTKEFEETLITNLSCDEANIKELSYLYHLRWGIETNYRVIKNQLEIENFSGENEIAILQDIYATLLISNFSSAARFDAQKLVDKRGKKNGNKHKYKVNNVMTIYQVKRNLVEMLLTTSKRKRKKLFASIIQYCSQNPVEIINNRTFERKKKHYTNKYSKNNRHFC